MKRSRLISLVVAMLMPLAAIADSYTSLWKQFDSAMQKDHPQSALKVLVQITDKAQRERAYGQLLKAQVSIAGCETMMSPDSLLPAIERLKYAEQTAVSNGDNVLAAVYQSVLGSVYTDNRRLLDDGVAIGKEYYAKSMAHPDALASAYATGYEPFVVDGVDSKYYYDDLLHVIGMRAGDYRTMHDYYASHGKREGALLTALELVKKSRRAGDEGRVKKSKYIMSLDSLVRQYGDLLPCGEVAIERYAYMKNAEDISAEEKMSYINYALMKWGAWQRMNILRNAQRRLTLPSFHASLGGEIALPGVARKVMVMGLNNIGQIRITASRLNIDGTTDLDPSNDKDYARLRRHIVSTDPVLTDVRNYVGMPAYKTISDTLEIKGLRTGMYLVEVSTDNVSMPVERRLLRVSNLYPVIEMLPGKKCRVAVLNATTGTAVPGAKVDVVMSIDRNGKEHVKTFTTDVNGEAYVEYKASEPRAYRVYTDEDKAFPRTSMGGRFYYYGNKAKVTQTNIYTDRRIYRPGQTVHAAAIAYTYNNNMYKGEALSGKQMTITLRDANRKEIAKRTVTTDEFGMASADFVLPEGGLTGIYTLRSDLGNNIYTNFSVEEYKRPTFKVDFEKPQTKYAAGDTVRFNATAKSFAGVPVQGAKAVVRVVRRPSVYWRYADNDIKHETVLVDTLQTSADGTFTVAVPMVMPETYDEHPRRYFNFDITADVTDIAGETRHGETSLPLSDYPTMLTCDIPEKSLRDSLTTITFAYCNNAGEPIDGTVTYTIDNNSYTCKANTPAKLDAAALASARHNLVAVCGTDTLTTSFVTFTLQDTKAPVETHDWFYQSAEQFPADGSPVYIQLGSTDSIQHVVYTIISGDKIIEEGRADLHNELRTRAISYKEEWGDGVALSVAWVKNGQSYKHTANIQRPLPDTRLNIKWTTFRDRLTPGQRETWTLNITRPDGTPARAQLLATMYDKSLDELRSHKISFALPVFVNMPWLTWNGVYNRNVYAYSEAPMRFLDERSLDFSRFCYQSLYTNYGEVLMAKEELAVSRPMYVRGNAASRKGKNKIFAGVIDTDRVADEGASVNTSRMLQSAGSADKESSSQVLTEQVRENLEETAFFYPGLISDDKGNVSINFTLPESVTTWQLYGLAHDVQMNSGMISATSVAKKTVMVQPNVPRFVRSTDSGIILARVSNTSDKQVDGTARLSFINPETGKEVYHADHKFFVKAGETVAANFDFDMSKIKNDGLLICRIVASAHGYSDGEQHYMPVLPSRELVTNTLAFTQNEPGTLHLDLKKMFAVSDKSNKLTVEYTNSPAWLMVQALPSMINPDGDNAISLATAYYANSIGRHLMQSTPVIKQTMELWKNEASQNGGSTLQSALQKNESLKQIVLEETPWLLDADRESEQKQQLMGYFNESQINYRLADNLSRLSRLQNADGSFAWWKGMEGSPYMTMSVLQTLTRLNHMVGEQNETKTIVRTAFAYMDKQMAREVKEMKKIESEGKVKNVRPSELAVQYLYASTLAGRDMQQSAKRNFDYLISRLAAQNTEFSIYGKAVSAVVLAGNNHRKQAADLLESIRQYTVYKEDMGRYFDTPKALYSWFDYRIPSQVAAIEALKALQPNDANTISEMQRWLLQSKRTQAWDTPLNSVNAVYAFLDGNITSLTENAGQPAVIKVNGQKLAMPKATAALGYVKSAKTGDNMRSLTIEKMSTGTSWGAAYAQFMQPTADVADATMGMKVLRDVLKDGAKLDNGNVQLNVGDRITVRLTVIADRDYDFVQLSDHRAACLEPAQQLSGYGYGYYCQPKDNATNYFFARLAKGKHVVETTYYVDRCGIYQTGTCTVQCAYSPEFMARTKAVTLNVKNN
ncbi:alpha-2-macroglobulin family protein [Prevotella sp.]|uniref:alpha-2-macroglobulin family protein n=1 Tax=Prevotella sp. TaxID=59823 RepID=UPI0027E3646F|nr:MG2 domain-containing protein [Prevotella sp.]